MDRVTEISNVVNVFFVVGCFLRLVGIGSCVTARK